MNWAGYLGCAIEIIHASHIERRLRAIIRSGLRCVGGQTISDDWMLSMGYSAARPEIPLFVCRICGDEVRGPSRDHAATHERDWIHYLDPEAQMLIDLAHGANDVPTGREGRPR